jgi:hypothetical protein
MVHVLFDTATLGVVNFRQVGGGRGFSYFRGVQPYQRGWGRVRVRQRGNGIGLLLGGLMKVLTPVLTKAGIAIGEEGLATGERIINDLKAGENLGTTLINQGKTGFKNLMKKVGLQKGDGKRHKRKRQVIIDPDSVIGKSVIRSPKRKRSDTFGFY